MKKVGQRGPVEGFRKGAGCEVSLNCQLDWIEKAYRGEGAGIISRLIYCWLIDKWTVKELREISH